MLVTIITNGSKTKHHQWGALYALAVEIKPILRILHQLKEGCTIGHGPPTVFK
jgi:hypothetical protein